jgi:hypothetical protein
MCPEPEEESETPEEVELISDGENLLVIGDDRRAVEQFLRARGLLERAREFTSQSLVPVLRSSAEIFSTVSEAVANSGLWVKLTPEAAEDMKEFGLTDSGVPGVAYAMAGTRGSIKKWLRIDTTTSAKLANPAILSGVAGALSQVARQQEAAQLRKLLETLDQKLDQVLRGQREEILGDLAGIEREIRATILVREMEGSIDSLTWSKLSGVSLQIRQVQSKAILKLGGIADDLEQHKRIGDLNARLRDAKREVQLWLSVIARCTTALDELAILELDHNAAIAPDRVDTRRLSLDASRQDDQVELHEGVSVLMQRMDSAACLANQNAILHVKGLPAVIRSIDDTRSLIKRFYEALSIEVDWDSVDPTQWRVAIREWQQWKNALAEAGTEAWDKGKPVLAAVAFSALGVLMKDKIKLPLKPGS